MVGNICPLRGAIRETSFFDYFSDPIRPYPALYPAPAAPIKNDCTPLTKECYKITTKRVPRIAPRSGQMIPTIPLSPPNPLIPP